MSCVTGTVLDGQERRLELLLVLSLTSRSLLLLNIEEDEGLFILSLWGKNSIENPVKGKVLQPHAPHTYDDIDLTYEGKRF